MMVIKMTKKGKGKKRTIKVDTWSGTVTGEELVKAAKIFTDSTLLNIKKDLIKEANTLFGGSTDAMLMVRKIDEVFSKYV